MANDHGSNFFSAVADVPNLSIALMNEDGNAILAKWDDAGAAPTTANLFAHGCLLIQPQSGGGNNSLMENTGTLAAPVWDLLGSVAGGNIALAQGSILVGNALGLASSVSAKANAQILIGDGTTLNSVSVSGIITISNTGSTSLPLVSTHILVGNAGGVAADVAMSGDTTISVAGVVSIGQNKVTTGDAITGNKLGIDVLMKTSKTITKSQMRQLNAAPIEIVPNVGIAQAIVPVRVVYKMIFNANVFDSVDVGDDLQLRYTNGAGALLVETETVGFLDQNSDQVRVSFPNSGSGALTTLTPVAGTNVVLSTPGSISAANADVNGDSSMTVDFYYVVVAV